MREVVIRRFSPFIGLMALAISANCFDVILDPAEVTKLLAEIGKFHQESKNLNALYEMGERVLDLTELMNKDLQSHGASDPTMIGLIVGKFKEYGITVTKDASGYQYDLAAFHEYLRRAPAGKRASSARYVLIGFDEPGDDAGRLLKSIADKERFIRDYPRFSEMSVVTFLLAQQHYRLGRVYASQKNQVLSDQQKKIAQDLYRQIVKLYPKSPEGEAAADWLAQTGAAK